MRRRRSGRTHKRKTAASSPTTRRKNPKGEDLAESALFAYTLIHHPNRIPKEEAAKIARAIPNRIAFVEKLLPKDKPLHFAVEAKPPGTTCSPSTTGATNGSTPSSPVAPNSSPGRPSSSSPAWAACRRTRSSC